MDCIFCEIIDKKKPAEFIKEDDDVVIIRDINPKAPVHLLVIPKKHILSIKDIAEDDKNLLVKIIIEARNIALKENLSGYKLIFNVGREGGQIIDHLHLHLLSGNNNKLNHKI